jgi:hypothetical protein
MSLGEQTLSTVMPLLQDVAAKHGLRLYIAREFKLARFILANTYMNFI